MQHGEEAHSNGHIGDADDTPAQQHDEHRHGRFARATEDGGHAPVPADPASRDGFDYLDGRDFSFINRAAERATLCAHGEGGVPCAQLTAERVDAYAFGQLYYTFMAACAVSGRLLGVNPFDQEGVEAYKRSMFKILGK